MTPKLTEPFKLSKKEYLEAIARETATMSFPRRMGGILEEGTKEAMEEYFVNEFPIEELWDGKGEVYKDYDGWHEEQTGKISKAVEEKLKDPKEYDADTISAKILNTFMHQLMKFERFQNLYCRLHLPLDNQVLRHLNSKLGRKKHCALPQLKELIQKYLKEGTYTMDDTAYVSIQKGLWDVLEDYNHQLEGTGIKLQSRIDLNAILWPLKKKNNKK